MGARINWVYGNTLSMECSQNNLYDDKW